MPMTLLHFCFFTFLLSAPVFANMAQDLHITWGNDHVRMQDNSNLLTLSLDRASGSGFQSNSNYLFGHIQMQIKLIPGNSAGTVTTYYLSSEGSNHDEIDFEFLGNNSGQPYTLHTNIYSNGKGGREQQFRLWFDPTANFHTYSILWNPINILFYVNETPIRKFKNSEKIGVPYPKSQAMKIYSSLWNADDWATQGGKVKTDWNLAPFVASFRGFKADACVKSSSSSCASLMTLPSTSHGWANQVLDSVNTKNLENVQSKYMIYNYCTDTKRFPQGFPPECADSI